MTFLEIRPQLGPQMRFLSSNADIVIYGGARGGGKSYALLLGATRYIHIPRFTAVFFRRTYPEITNPGGLWEVSQSIYPHLQGRPSKALLDWTFPSGARISMRHLKLEDHKLAWMGQQVALINWDELTHFSFTQFLFLLGSNRSISGVLPQIRATCNPDANSWVRQLVDPWIADDGYYDPIAPPIQYVIFDKQQIQFVDADYRDELGLPAYRLAFIPADVWDNPILLQQNPAYLRALQSQTEVNRDRFLGIRGRGGNWNVQESGGKLFKRDWLRSPIDQPITQSIRFWDFAASIPQQRGDDPDRTASIRMDLYANGDVLVSHQTNEWLTPAQRDRRMLELCAQDGRAVQIGWFTDPAQAGMDQTYRLRQLLKGWNTTPILDRQNKVQRFSYFSRAAEFSEVKVSDRFRWASQVRESSEYLDWVTQLEQFPDAAHDDLVDATAGAYNTLTGVYQLEVKTGSYRS